MSIVQSVTGSISVEIVSADPTWLVDMLCRQGISIRDLEYRDELTLRFTISRSEGKRLAVLLDARDIIWRVAGREGIFWSMRSILFRPVLLLGLLFFLLGTYLIPGRIFFVRVEGNSIVESNEILEAAADLGVKFGASRRLVRSEEIKNGILSAVGELEWAGVNTRGCVAIISVREHPPAELSTTPQGVSDVVALRDGIILSCDVTEGTALCYPGQAAKQGQILISGTVDHGIAVTSAAAEGEVFAVTQRHFTALTHGNGQSRRSGQGQKEKFSLQIGKNLINFFKGSGISGGTCVKMYSKYVLTLPGGFTLPVSLIKWTILPCDLVPRELSEDEAQSLLSDFADRYLNTQMIAGRIIRKDEVLSRDGSVYQLTGNYACTEMIGRVQQEQIGAYNGKTD